MKGMRIAVIVLLAVAFVASGPLVASSHDKEKAKDPHAGHGHAAPAGSPEQDAMMQAWTKAMTPGEPHQAMAALAGTWDATVTSWMDPSQPPTSSSAKAVRTMILGGRVMQDEWTGNMMGMPFEGLGLGGHDNASGKAWSIWLDNFGTGYMVAEGSCDMAAGVCNYTGSFVDPMSGKPTKNRTKVWWPSADEERMEMYMPGPDGKEWKSMEIVAKRVKS